MQDSVSQGRDEGLQTKAGGSAARCYIRRERDRQTDRDKERWDRVRDKKVREKTDRDIRDGQTRTHCWICARSFKLLRIISLHPSENNDDISLLAHRMGNAVKSVKVIMSAIH